MELVIKVTKWKASTLLLFILLLFTLLIYNPGPLVFFQPEEIPPAGAAVLPTEEVEEKKGVRLIKLVDEACDLCYDVGLHNQILARFGVEIVEEETIDMNSKEGKELVEKYKITAIPTIILSPEANQSEALMRIWPQVGSIESDGYLVFRELGLLRATYQIIHPDGSLELVEYGVVETGDQETKLLLFVMSLCPFCIMLEHETLPRFIQDFPEIEIEAHYVLSKDEEGNFVSLHGEREIQGNKEEICAAEQGRWHAYATCRYTFSREEGIGEKPMEECIGEVGLNRESFLECLNTTAIAVLNEDIELSNRFQVTGTPTLFLNYKGKARLIQASWRDYDSFKAEVCKLTNNEPAVCKG